MATILLTSGYRRIVRGAGESLMRMLSTFTHGVLDYVMAVALLIAPNLFGFADAGGAAVMLPRTLGIVMLLMAMATRYELGVMPVIPMRAHLTADLFAGILLMTSPWVFEFVELPMSVWMPHVLAGLFEVAAALTTETDVVRVRG